MPRVRKIQSIPPAGGRNYFVIDANFLANKHIPPKYAPNDKERARIEACAAWWERIESLLADDHARVFVPDVCIAEAFKVLARKYYEDKWFPSAVVLGQRRKRLSEDIRISTKVLKGANRKIRYHDVSTNRDIIISVDRFYELFMKNGKKVQIADLILVATAKYLLDFFDLPRELVHIVTLDKPLREGICKVTELPAAYDPTLKMHRAEVVFG